MPVTGVAERNATGTGDGSCQPEGICDVSTKTITQARCSATCQIPSPEGFHKTEISVRVWMMVSLACLRIRM